MNAPDLKFSFRRLLYIVLASLLLVGCVLTFSIKPNRSVPVTSSDSVVEANSIKVEYLREFPQRISLSGHVVNDKAAVPNSNVELILNDVFYPTKVTTDAAGQFNFPNVIVSPGPIRILIKASPLNNPEGKESPETAYKI